MEIEALKKINKSKEAEIQKLVEGDQNKMKKNVDNLEDEIRLLDLENKELKETVSKMKTEEEALINKSIVENMIFEDFKERMKMKYLYDSDDEESEYESDEEKREKSREIFRKRKQEQRSRENKCKICEFTGKTSGGLKTHIRKKHTVQP